MAQTVPSKKFICQYCTKQVTNDEDVGHMVSEDQYFHINCLINTLSQNFSQTLMYALNLIPDVKLRQEIELKLGQLGQQRLKQYQDAMGQGQAPARGQNQ